MRRRVYINWGISAYFGWGVYGLNLVQQWLHDPEIEPIGVAALSREHLGVDPLRAWAIDGFIRCSEAIQGELRVHAGQMATINGPVLSAVGGDFRSDVAAHGVRLAGRPEVAVTFFETTRLKPEAVSRAAAYSVVVTGSTWNADILREFGVANVQNVFQGVDRTLFHPGPRLGVLGDRFAIFSGGKVEKRKGQDIVLAAFARFAQRHEDAILVTAWHSPWTEFAQSMDEASRAAPIVLNSNGSLDVKAWAQASGVKPDAVIDLGIVPNAAMPQLLREMDLAVFPNRAEGGTNLVAMEAMACGVPVVLSANTGHLDLIEKDNCFVLQRQVPLAGMAAGVGEVAGWGESDVEELIGAMELAYSDRAAARRIGAHGAASISRFDWAETARQMKEIALSPSASG